MKNKVGWILLWVVLVAGPAFSQDRSSQDLPSGVTFVPDNGVSAEAPADQSATQPAVASQQPAVHPAAIDYGHGYEVRAKIHKYASYTTLPLFGAQIIVGQKLRNELDRGENTQGGLKTAHTALATGIVGLFAVNSVTGVWNLVESRKDPNNGKLRLAHSIMMLGGSLVLTWASYYANHGIVRTLVEFGHLAPLIAGAGLAVTSDTEVLRLSEQHYERRHSVLDRLRASHDIVLVSLGLIVISGGLMFAADVDTYLHSVYFWIKMGLVVLLLVNGAFLRYADSRVMYNPDDDRHWHRVRRAAALSFMLWFVTTFIGVALPNVA